MANKLVLLTDKDIEKQARGRVLNNDNLNLKYKTNDAEITVKEYKLGGLYDPKIFGYPNRCPCNRTNVVNVRCPVCQCLVLSDDDYITSFGYYKMNIPFLTSIKVDGLISKLKQYFPINARNLKDLWSISIDMKKVDSVPKNSDKSYVKYGDQIFEIEFSDIPEEVLNPAHQYAIEYFGLFGLSYLSDFYTLSGESLRWIDSFINYDLIISSPAIRPASKVMTGEVPKYTFHELTINYGALIELNETLPLLMNQDYTRLVDKLTLCYYFNCCINKVMADNELLLPSKESFVRNIVDTRLSKSARANIVSALDLEMDKLYVPRTLAYKALQVDIINKLIRDINYASEADCIKMYKNKDPKALDAFQHIIDNCMVTLVRNPSLHRFALQAFHPILWDEVAIG